MIENSHNLTMLVEVLNAIKRNQAISGQARPNNTSGYE